MYSFQITSLEHKINHHLPRRIFYERKRILGNVEQSLTSTMHSYFLPTTDRDMSIKAHLVESRCMENEFQQLLHLMSYETDFSL